jgi:hypothetical protein
MNHRLLTSAVAIHATACIVAFLAVGPGEAGANARDGGSSFLQMDSLSNSTRASDLTGDAADESLFQADLTEEEWSREINQALPVEAIPELKPELPMHDRAEVETPKH